ncbi:MAG: hypothetical protein IH986_03230, partial [Planctomycetes bacterium]|nr:hypothetical protein [Planctomycetota bacterium]
MDVFAVRFLAQLCPKRVQRTCDIPGELLGLPRRISVAVGSKSRTDFVKRFASAQCGQSELQARGRQERLFVLLLRGHQIRLLRLYSFPPVSFGNEKGDADDADHQGQCDRRRDHPSQLTFSAHGALEAYFFCFLFGDGALANHLSLGATRSKGAQPARQFVGRPQSPAGGTGDAGGNVLAQEIIVNVLFPPVAERALEVSDRHLIQQHAERVDVTLNAGRLAGQKLGGHLEPG